MPYEHDISFRLFHQLQELKLQYKYMACSKYEYVKKFEEQTSSLPQTYILVRIDGRGFTKFCAAHEFTKPNDLRAIDLMNAAAHHVCNTFTEIFLAYGQSDEYSFVFNKHTSLFSRRTDKILTCVVSAFTGAYVALWSRYFQREMIEIPSFDGRIVIYPNDLCLKDYFRWRQVDCHINNLYNTVFWKMVGKGMSHTQVEQVLKDTNSAQKNEILFNEFATNYNNLEAVFRRGTFLLYEKVKIEQEKEKEETAVEQAERQKDKGKEKRVKQQKVRRKLVQSHEDCIKQQFWLTLLQ